MCFICLLECFVFYKCKDQNSYSYLSMIYCSAVIIKLYSTILKLLDCKEYIQYINFLLGRSTYYTVFVESVVVYE